MPVKLTVFKKKLNGGCINKTETLLQKKYSVNGVTLLKSILKKFLLLQCVLHQMLMQSETFFISLYKSAIASILF